MEEKYINQIELAGRVGTVLKKVVGDTEYAHFLSARNRFTAAVGVAQWKHLGMPVTLLPPTE